MYKKVLQVKMINIKEKKEGGGWRGREGEREKERERERDVSPRTLRQRLLC